MQGLQLADDIVEMIRARDGRFHPQAYLFLLAALEHCQQDRKVRGHISGRELAWSCRDFAREQFGLTAPTVLAHWGVRGTKDLGHIVFVLVELGLLAAQPEDRIEDFEGVYDFVHAFGDYPWSGVTPAAQSQRQGR